MDNRELERLIPGLAEVRAKERATRLMPWVTGEVYLCGVWVNQLTLRHVLELEFAGNRLVSREAQGGRAEDYKSDAYLFLWRLSGSFTRRVRWLSPAWFARRRVRKAVLRRSAVNLAAAIRTFIAEQEQDRPPTKTTATVDKGGIQQEPQHHWVADYINFCGEVYGWSRDTALDTPLPLMNQLYRAHHAFHGNPIPSFSAADRMIGEAVKAATKAVTQRKKGVM